jgi:hypothetical protein
MTSKRSTAPRSTLHETTLRLHTRPIHYRWSTPDGATHHASTVLLSRTRAGLRSALKRFWITNRHVDPDQDFTRDTAATHYHHAHQEAV